MSLQSEQREDGESTSSSSESTEAKTDRYGFLLSNGETQNHGDDLSPGLVRQREMKWLSLMSQWDQVIEKKTSKIKVQCQKGIPASVRSKCWPLLCGAAERMKKNVNLYENLESAPGQQSWIDVIKRDTDRQFPFHEMFQSKDGQGQQCLLQVLKAYTEFRPDEGYCQAQGPVAAVLLMNLPTEEAFWCLVQISELYLPGYYSPLLEGVLFDAAILSGVLKKACPTAYKLMQRQGVEPLMFATDWLMCLYSRHLPFNTLLRVWDLFFCYGVRVLFQVAVVLVRRCLGEARQRKECEGQMDTLERLRAVRERVQHEQTDTFIHEVCSVHLSLAELQRLTDKEFDKWKKERPDSTFDPRNRCHGYHMVWEKAREREEKEKENEMKERSSGNLVVPVTRSHSSLSPAVLRKILRKRGSKVETEEWEGGGRRWSQAKREEFDSGGKRTASVSSTTGELKTDRIPQEFSTQAQDCSTQPDTQCKAAEEETHSSDQSDKNTPVVEEEEKDVVDSAVISQEVTITESVGQEQETKVSTSLNEHEAEGTEPQAAIGPSQDGTQGGEILMVQDDQDRHQVQHGSETKQEKPSRGSSPLEEEEGDTNAKPEDETLSDEGKQTEVVQPSAINSEEALHLNNVNQEEGLQSSTINPEEELHSSTINPEEELQSCTINPEEDFQSSTINPEEDFQSCTINPEEDFQSSTINPEEELKSSTINPEEKTENNSCKSEEEIQLDTSKQGQEIYIKSRTEETDIQNCTCNETEVYISKQEEDIEMKSCKQDMELQEVNSTEPVELETHADIQERELQLSSCEHEQEKEVTNENEEAEIDCKHEEEIRLSSEQEKDISPGSMEEEGEMQPNSNKLQEEKEGNYDNDKEKIQECPAVQEDTQEDAELKHEVQDSLETGTLEAEMVLETVEDGQAQTNVQVPATELHGHESETDGEAPEAEKAGENIVQVSDAPEDGTVTEDHSVKDETSEAAATSTVICVPVQHEPETASGTSGSQEDLADQQAEENTQGTTISAPEIQPGSTDSELELPPKIQVNSLTEDLQSASVPSNPVKPTGSSSNPSHPQLRLRRTSSSQCHPTILSEDTFKEPQHGGKDASQASRAEPEHTPGPDTAFQTQTVPAQSKADKPKRRGLFHLLKADATTKSSIPKILIQDFSEGEEKLSSRERRRRRREQERKEKEEEKERKRREKELEKEKLKERKKIKTRGRSFQMLSRKHDDNSVPVGSHAGVSKRNSVPYTDGYF